jgi:acyl transferase domain-containing protein
MLCVQASSADDKFADYKPSVAFLFPGQGAQAVGMAKVSRCLVHTVINPNLVYRESQA